MSSFPPRAKAGVSEPAPHAPLEVRISIRGETWGYVLRAIAQLADHIAEHGPDCGMVSGGGGGSYSVDIRRREVSAEKYRAEMAAWHSGIRAEANASEK